MGVSRRCPNIHIRLKCIRVLVDTAMLRRSSLAFRICSLLAININCIGNSHGFSLSSLSSYQPDTSPEIQRFLEFLEEEECEGIGATEIGFRDGLRGIFAAEDFLPNEYILAVPFVTCVMIHESIYDMANQDGDASNVEMGAHLMKKLTNSPHWQPYFDCLPTVTSNFDPTPDFWDEETIRQLEFPKLVNDILAVKRETETSAEHHFATWLVRSRAFSTFKLLPNANEKRIRTRTVLIPYLDFLNHNALSSNAEIRKIESKHDEESFFALVATKPIQRGEQVTITYGTGHETSLDLFSKYGFWTIDNQNDSNLNLDNVAWSTSLEDDEQRLLEDEALSEDVRNMLSLRAHLKRIQQNQ